MVYDQISLPVAGCIACTPPSPEPKINIGSPLITAVVGDEYVVSNGKSRVPLNQTTTPLFLSKAMKRWAGFAISPQPVTTALMMT
jgi:hypothetical protein